MGIRDESGETVIGTDKGVVKCRTVSRMCSELQWDLRMVTQMQGVPWEVVPGKLGTPVLVEIRNDGTLIAFVLTL